MQRVGEERRRGLGLAGAGLVVWRDAGSWDAVRLVQGGAARAVRCGSLNVMELVAGGVACTVRCGGSDSLAAMRLVLRCHAARDHGTALYAECDGEARHAVRHAVRHSTRYGTTHGT